MKQVLAFDFGASSGRAMLGRLENRSLVLEEIHRFPNEPVLVSGTLYWDVLRLFHEVKQGILLASRAGIDSIGIDTWGVDFGLLDKHGVLLENPVHYRDARNNGRAAVCREMIPEAELYALTGIPAMDINTLSQLLYLVRSRPDVLERAETLLMMPDLFVYFLTGTKQSEYTEASTSQLLDVRTKTWSQELTDRMGIPHRLFPDVVPPGTPAGVLRGEICRELGVPEASVSYHESLLSNYFIHDPQDASPPLLMTFYLFVLLLVSVSLILIIHNSFAVSMNARVHQFGIFSSVGAAPGQIRACLLQEAAMLCVIPVLLGSFLGIALTFGAIQAVNALADGMAGRHEAVFAYHPLVLAATLLSSLLTVLISAWLPAGKLSRMTPLEAIKNTGELQLKRRKTEATTTSLRHSCTSMRPIRPKRPDRQRFCAPAGDTNMYR